MWAARRLGLDNLLDVVHDDHDREVRRELDRASVPLADVPSRPPTA